MRLLILVLGSMLSFAAPGWGASTHSDCIQRHVERVLAHDLPESGFGVIMRSGRLVVSSTPPRVAFGRLHLTVAGESGDVALADVDLVRSRELWSLPSRLEALGSSSLSPDAVRGGILAARWNTLSNSDPSRRTVIVALSDGCDGAVEQAGELVRTLRAARLSGWGVLIAVDGSAATERKLRRAVRGLEPHETWVSLRGRGGLPALVKPPRDDWDGRALQIVIVDSNGIVLESDIAPSLVQAAIACIQGSSEP